MRFRPLLRILVLAFWLTLAVASVACVQDADEPEGAGGKKDRTRTKIGIMEFEVAKDLNPGLGGFLYRGLLGQMLRSGKFTVVDSAEINRVVRRDVPDDEAKRQAIRQLRLQKLYLGNVVKVGRKYHVSVKVLNADMTVDRLVQDAVPSEDGLEESIDFLARVLLADADESRELQKARSEEKKEPEEKSDPLKEIGGRWRISVEPYYYSDWLFTHRDFYIIPTDTMLLVRQYGDAVQFDAKTLTDLAGNTIENTFKGTFRDKVLRAESTKRGALGLVQITGYVDEDGETIRGSVKYWQMTSAMTMTRLDAPPGESSTTGSKTSKPRRGGSKKWGED